MSNWASEWPRALSRRYLNFWIRGSGERQGLETGIHSVRAGDHRPLVLPFCLTVILSNRVRQRERGERRLGSFRARVCHRSEKKGRWKKEGIRRRVIVILGAGT